MKKVSEKTLKERERKQKIREETQQLDGIFPLRGRYSFKSPTSKRVWGHFEEKFIPAHDGCVDLNLPTGTTGAVEFSEYRIEIPTGQLNRKGNPEVKVVYRIPVEELLKHRCSKIQVAVPESKCIPKECKNEQTG